MILREPFITKVKRKKVMSTKYGKIEKITDTLFGGWEYAVFDRNDDYVLGTINLDEAMQKLSELQ